MEPLVLAVNPGSASRKYALYRRGVEHARLHIEQVGEALVMQGTIRDDMFSKELSGAQLTDGLAIVIEALKEREAIASPADIGAVAIRIVAPSAHFLQDVVINQHELTLLRILQTVAPLHIEATLNEIALIRENFKNAQITGISDSAFHAKKPDYTWNYAIDLADADNFDIKRFGYHGISLESVKNQLKAAGHELPLRTVVCHIGGGVSATALYNGKSVDTTMGYSPNEGMMMATRSGSIDFSAGLALAKRKRISADDLAVLLNRQSGLLGVSGTSSDVRELLKKESNKDYRASLALAMYVYAIRQAIARMAASLEGIDALVFTGTVGFRSAPMRARIIHGLSYLNMIVDNRLNESLNELKDVNIINPRIRSKKIFVVRTNEERIMAMRSRALLK